MNNRRKMTLIVVIIFAICVGGYEYQKNFNVKSDLYLSSKSENKRFESKTGLMEKQSINFKYDKFDGRWSFYRVTPSEDCSVTVEYDSKLNRGEVYFVVLTSDYDIIDKRLADGNGEIVFNAEKGKEYLIRMAGRDGAGYVDVDVSFDKQCDLEYLDLFRNKI